MRLIKSFVAAILVASMVGCNGGKGGGFSDRKVASNPGVFRYPLPTVPTTYDPAKVQDGDTIDVIQQVFEGLVKWGEDNRVQPNLAESWDIGADNKTYTFHLKKGVKFSNGREVTADDFKWCIERACNPKYTSTTAGTYLADIVGVKERLAGKAAEVAGVKVIDANTLQITIDKPRPYFLDKLTYACSFVYAKEALPDPLQDMSKIEEMVGTGPFVYSKIEQDVSVVMKANKGYHGGAPLLETIERPILKDAQSRLNKFKTGEVDLVQLERDDLKSVNEDPALKDQLKFFERPSMYYLGMNCDVVPALKDRRVRQAIAMALDRDKIVNDVLGGINRRADAILPPSVKHFREKTAVFAFDLPKAKALLAEAGFPEGKGFPEMEFCYRDGRPDVEIVAQALQQQLKQNLNINLKPRKMEWGSYLQFHNSKKIPIFHMRWGADYLDPENFLSTLLASYGNENKVNYKNAEYDALCAQADGILDENKRAELYAKAEDIVLQDAPFVPIYYQKDAELISPKVSGLRESAFGHLPHTTTRVK
ncbi:MAG TPA: peptide ABC transporter substrate-binding protein [Fimbriimonas sp.]|nr:peptide ABC transporter substrate-binding protein [Fimbriimonas sp.]